MAIIPSDEKVFMVSNSTNTVYGGSAAMQAMTKWYTMEDVIDTVRPYQVFTALLTQSGGDDFQAQLSGAVQKGVTYFVDGGTIGVTDFSNVGGQFQTPETGSYYFVATINGLPNEYGGASVDYNTGAPVVTVLENTIGNIWFTYLGTGIGGINSDSKFIVNKTVAFGTGTGLGDDLIINFDLTTGPDTVYIFTKGENGSLESNYGSPIEIRVYS